jgi:putative membrane protein
LIERLVARPEYEKVKLIVAVSGDVPLDDDTMLLWAIGAAIGLVTFAQFLSWLFKQYHDLTVALLIGLMVGSLRKIWPWKMDLDWLRDALGNFVLDSEGHRLVIKQANVLPDFSSSAGITEFIIAVVLALVGIGVILFIDRLAARIEINP